MIKIMMLRNLSTSVLDQKKQKKPTYERGKTIEKIYKRVKKSLRKRFGSSNNKDERSASIDVNFEREIDQVSEISNGSEVNSQALHQVREQMALSLARMKELEDQVKVIPNLQSQLKILREEKRLLQLEIKRSEEKSRSTSKSSSPPTTTSGIFTPQRVSPVSLTSLNDTISHIKNKKQFKESGTCTSSPLTRDVGVAPPSPPRMQSLGVDTELSILPNERLYTKRDLDQFLHQQIAVKWMNQVSIGVQVTEPKALLRSNGTQTTVTPEAKKILTSVGIMTKPQVKEAGVHYAPQLKSIGVSDHTVASVKTQTIGVGPDSWATPSVSQMAISLKSLDRSSSFSLAEHEKLKIRRKHTGVQCSTLVAHASTQHHPISANKMVQNVPEAYSQTTDTKGLVEHRNVYTGTETTAGKNKDASSNTDLVRTRDQGVSARDYPKRLTDMGSNTDKIALRSTGCGDSRLEIRDLSPDRPKTLNLTKTIVERTNMPPSPLNEPASRIPKLSPSPTATRKFVRQNTYTVASQPTPKPPVAARTFESQPTINEGVQNKSQLEQPEETRTINRAKTPEPIVTMRQTTVTETEVKPLQQEAELVMIEKETSPDSHQNEIYESEEEEVVEEKTKSSYELASPNVDRTKADPSKEMLAALKVINDSLSKSSGATTNLKNATKITQKEWFKVSSTEAANPLDVEDYLDCFDEFSSNLLRYMVNLSDTNGNTAMHYAVSHGNFDVVSILLDSKVCHVNLTNNAGYTSVMLVSLAKLQTPEHRTVVQRLFQMSDVNIRAKKHNQTALMLAVSHGNIEMVKMLLEAGADINIQDDDGSTALMCAAEHGRIDIVKLLLSHPECDSTVQDIDGSTALKISLEAGYRDIGVLLYAHERIRNKSPYSSLRRKKERTISGGSNGAGKSASAKTSPLPSPKFVARKEPFRP